MNLHELVTQNRSYRRFDPSAAISTETLRELVDLARLSATGANRQPLRFLLANQPSLNAKIFPHLSWAGYLKDWPGPAEGERPSAYIVILLDTSLSKTPGCDHGIAAQSILLGAAERGLGGCMIGSVKRDELCADLHLEDRYEILLVLALGKPVERVFIEELPADGSIQYWRDAQGGHHVPKRSLDDLIIQ